MANLTTDEMLLAMVEIEQGWDREISRINLDDPEKLAGYERLEREIKGMNSRGISVDIVPDLDI